jgi:hypothetical protein
MIVVENSQTVHSEGLSQSAPFEHRAGRSDPRFPVVVDMGQPATGAVDDERR